jgi:uncharacterized protein (TIGR03083 family)
MSDEMVNSKAELVEKIQAAWDAFNAYIDSLDAVQLTEPTDAAGWSAKDHIAHLAVWESGMVAMLESLPRHERMGLAYNLWISGDYDAINAVLQERDADLPLAEVRQWFAEVHQQLLDKIDALSYEDLLRPYNYYQPDSDRQEPAIERIIGNTYEHYPEHQEWIAVIVGE